MAQPLNVSRGKIERVAWLKRLQSRDTLLALFKKAHSRVLERIAIVVRRHCAMHRDQRRQLRGETLSRCGSVFATMTFPVRENSKNCVPESHERPMHRSIGSMSYRRKNASRNRSDIVTPVQADLRCLVGSSWTDVSDLD